MLPLSVLVVEDNEANQRLVRYLLGSRGYEPHIASTAGEALEMLKTLRPRLILMDVQLPDKNGYELTRLLRADPATRGLKIVAFTACAMKSDEEEARRVGCDGYITKPIDNRSFHARILEFIGEAGVSGGAG